MTESRPLRLLLVPVLVMLIAGCGSDAPVDPQAVKAAEHVVQLKASDLHVREQAAIALGDLGSRDPVTLAALRTALAQDSEKQVREAAAHALGLLKDTGAWDALVAQKTDAESGLRLEVTQALAAIDAVRALPLMQGMLADDDESVRLAAAAGLAAAGAPGVQALLDILAKGGEPAVMVVGALAKAGTPAAQAAVLDAVTKGGGAVRLAAVRAAGAVKLAAAVPALTTLASTGQASDPKLAGAAVEALGLIATPDALLALLPFATDKERSWITAQAQARAGELRPTLIARLRDPATPAVLATTILDVLRDDRSSELYTAMAGLIAAGYGEALALCRTLAEAGPAAAAPRQQAASALRGRLVDEKDSRRINLAVQCLGWVGAPGDGPDGQSCFAQFARAASASDLRRSAAEACGRLRVAAAVPELRAMLASGDPDQVVTAINALAALGDQDSVPMAVAAVQAPKGNLWRTVKGGLPALARFKDARVLPLHEKWMRDYGAMKDIRDTAIDAAAATGLSAAADLLCTYLADPAIEVAIKRERVAFALAAMKQVAAPALLRLALTAGEPKDGHDPGWWAADLLRDSADGVVNDLGKAIADGKPKARVLARLLFALSGGSSPPAVDLLASHLRDSDVQIRRLAARLIAERKRTNALPAVEAALVAETDAQTRAALARTSEMLKAKN